MFKPIETDLPSPLDHSQLTGENLVEEFKKGKVTLSKEVLGGQQSALIEITWHHKKYLIILQNNPNIFSGPEAAELCEKLMDAKSQHPHVIKFIPITDKNTGKLLIQQIRKKAATRDFIGSKVHKTINSWYHHYNNQRKMDVDPEDQESIIKLSCMESVSICELAEGVALEKKLTAENKDSIQELKINSVCLEQSLRRYRSIVESVLHINALFGAHGDISGVNVMIGADGHCTLIDIGCAIKANKQGMASGIPHRDLAAPAYLAPELLTTTDPTQKVLVKKIDTWGLVVLLVQLLTGKNNPNIFNLAEGFPKDPKVYLENLYSTHFFGKSTPIDKTLESALPDCSLGQSITCLLNNAFKIDPRERLSVAEILLYLGYSPEDLENLIRQNLFLAMRNSNPSMVKEFFRILIKNSSRIIPSEKIIIDALSILENCRDKEIISVTIDSIIEYAGLLKKSPAQLRELFDKLQTPAFYLECSGYLIHSSGDIQLIHNINKSVTFSHGTPAFSEDKAPALAVQEKGLELAIMADNYPWPAKISLNIITRKNIIHYLQLAVKYSEKSLQFLIFRGFKLFQRAPQSFLHFILKNDHILFKYILPYIPDFTITDIHSKDSEGNTLLHLAAKKLDSTLFILFILLGGDYKINNKELKDSLFCWENAVTLGEFNHSAHKKMQVIGKFLFLLNNKHSFSSSFSFNIFSKRKSDDKELDTIPPKSYSSYRNTLKKYLDLIIIDEINLQSTKGVRYLLESASCSNDFYKISEIILIILENLIKLEEDDITLTDLEKCFSCLKHLKSALPKFPNSLFLRKISEIEDRVRESRSVAICTEEAKQASAALTTAILQRDVEKTELALSRAHCFAPNPLWIRKDNKEFNCAPIDYIVKAIKDEKWCQNTKIEKLLKYAVDIEDDDQVYDWYKINRVECQIIYALARADGSETGAERRSTNRLIQYMNLVHIDCIQNLTAICMDKDQGFYLCTTAGEHKRIQSLIEPGIKKWNAIGTKLMDSFNSAFEIKSLSTNKKKVNTESLVKCITKLRDCVYDALIQTDEDYIKSFEKLVRTVGIPEELSWLTGQLENFLLNPMHTPTSLSTEKQSTVDSLFLLS